MNKHITGMEKILSLSIGFTVLMLVARVSYSREYTYGFYLWNIFLAIIPFLCSRKLAMRSRIDVKSVWLLASWLLFFPNAPYLLTDLFHFRERVGAPAWFDMILVSSASWNGLVLGILSLLQVEQFLCTQVKQKWIKPISAAFILLCGYGIYLGRFLRFNSWDIVARPIPLFSSIYHSVLHPVRHTGTWAFTIIFSIMLGIAYAVVRQVRDGLSDNRLSL